MTACNDFAGSPASHLFKYFSRVNGIDMGSLPNSIILVGPHPDPRRDHEMVATLASRKMSYLLFKTMSQASALEAAQLYQSFVKRDNMKGPARMMLESSAHVHLPSGYTLSLRSLDGKGEARDLTMSVRRSVMKPFGPHPVGRYLVPIYSNNAKFDSLYVETDVENDTEDDMDHLENDIDDPENDMDDLETDMGTDLETDTANVGTDVSTDRETEVDGVYLFQMTVSTTHDIQMSGLESLVKRLPNHIPWRGNRKPWNFVFVVPPPIADAYQAQRIVTTQAQPPCVWERYIHQYVASFEPPGA